MGRQKSYQWFSEAVVEKERSTKELERNFWDVGSVLYLDCEGNCTTL